jgi:hypothetical protein
MLATIKTSEASFHKKVRKLEQGNTCAPCGVLLPSPRLLNYIKLQLRYVKRRSTFISPPFPNVNIADRYATFSLETYKHLYQVRMKYFSVC